MIRLDTWVSHTGSMFDSNFMVRSSWFRITGVIRLATSSYYMATATWRDRFGFREHRFSTYGRSDKTLSQGFMRFIRDDVEMRESEHWFFQRTRRKIRLMPEGRSIWDTEWGQTRLEIERQIDAA